MTDRIEEKLREVAIVRYEYRHDAEFAAGFLDDAGIPYRLQLDDPALGISVGVSATIWVRAMDVERAREILEVDHRAVSLSRRVPSRHERLARRQRETRREQPVGREQPVRREQKTRPERLQPHRSGAGSDGGALAGRERLISLLLSGATLAAGQLAAGGDVTGPVGYVTAGIAAILALVAMLGRAPGAIRRLLSALSGNAP
jgi:hypothetical protein